MCLTTIIRSSKKTWSGSENFQKGQNSHENRNRTHANEILPDHIRRGPDPDHGLRALHKPGGDAVSGNIYIPDNWVVIKFGGDDPHYRVLGGWSGGYIDGDSWRMNSGIVRVEDVLHTHTFNFHGSTGSCYECNKIAYGLRINNTHVWGQLVEIHGDKVELMPEDTDWMKIDWIIK